MRPTELKNLKTEFRNNLDAFNQIISPIEEAKDQNKLKNEEIKRRTEKFRSKNPLDFTEYLEMQKEGNEIDLGLVFE